MMQDEPVMCTLTEEERSARTLRWHDVVERHATSMTETPDGYALTLNVDERMLPELMDLAEAERGCCRWMRLQVRGGSPAILTITAQSPEGKTAIGRMLGR